MPVLATALVTLTALLAACGGGGKPIDSLTTTPATGAASGAPATSGPPLTATQRTIVARYRLFWTTIEQAWSTDNFNDPRLADVATDNELMGLVQKMAHDSTTGTTYRGTVILNPGVPVITDNGLVATLHDCQDGKDFLPYHNGQVVGYGVARNDGAVATLWLVDGVWKVAGLVTTVGRCDGT